MKKTLLTLYYLNCSKRTLVLHYEKLLTEEMSYRESELKTDLIDKAIDKRMNDQEYAFLCAKYLPTKNPPGSAGSMLTA